MEIATSRAAVMKQGGVVVLPVKEYRRLLAATVPEYFLTGRAATRLDKLVEEGLREHREGKTTVAASITDALTKRHRKNEEDQTLDDIAMKSDISKGRFLSHSVAWR